MVVDIHTHVYTRSYLEALSRRTNIPRVDIQSDGEHFVIFENETELLGGTRPMSTAFFNLDDKLTFMRDTGIDRSVISFGNPWLDFFGPAEAVEWAQSVNEQMAVLAALSPAIDSLGVLPLQNPIAAEAEVRSIAAAAALKGVIIGTRSGESFLDQPELDPVWCALEETQLPVFIHPHYCAGYDWMGGYGHAMPLALAFPFETTATAMRLVLSGVFDRYPRLQILLAHAGGTLPFLVGRLEKCVAVDSLARRTIQRPVSEYLRMLYYDAVTYNADALRCAIALAGTDHLMFGTDHPFGIADPGLGLSAIRDACTSEADREAIRSGNAERIFALSSSESAKR